MNTIKDDLLKELLKARSIDFDLGDDYSELNINTNLPEIGDVLIECTYYTDGGFDHVIYTNGIITEKQLPVYQQKMIMNEMESQESKIIEFQEIEKRIEYKNSGLNESRIKDHI